MYGAIDPFIMRKHIECCAGVWANDGVAELCSACKSIFEPSVVGC